VVPAVAILALAPAVLPAWWSAFLKAPALESPFVQESESAVFGSLKKQGHLSVARGGRLRVAYEGGLLLVSDGRGLVQYDPDARTAQRFDLRAAQAEVPLLGLLLDPSGLPVHFEIQPRGGGRVRLKPRRAGLPEVELEGGGASPTLIRWVDASGAAQVLRLTAPRTPTSLPESRFRFEAPAGTRWVGGK
jgi:outer membrane lipoprotein-sorting protein